MIALRHRASANVDLFLPLAHDAVDAASLSAGVAA